jgi:flagellar biosynthesis GTPase FlhF
MFLDCSTDSWLFFDVAFTANTLPEEAILERISILLGGCKESSSITGIIMISTSPGHGTTWMPASLRTPGTGEYGIPAPPARSASDSVSIKTQNLRFLGVDTQLIDAQMDQARSVQNNRNSTDALRTVAIAEEKRLIRAREQVLANAAQAETQREESEQQEQAQQALITQQQTQARQEQERQQETAAQQAAEEQKKLQQQQAQQEEMRQAQIRAEQEKQALAHQEQEHQEQARRAALTQTTALATPASIPVAAG